MGGDFDYFFVLGQVRYRPGKASCQEVGELGLFGPGVRAWFPSDGPIHPRARCLLRSEANGERGECRAPK